MGPQVLIPNYVASPANCKRHTAYYSACCTTGCEEVMDEIEGAVLASEAPPEMLFGVVSSISTASVEAPRLMRPSLVKQLNSIAALHGGAVPLHGRLFSQWLHFAFPSECPHPKSYVSSSMRNQWLDFESAHASATIAEEERARQANVSNVQMFASEASVADWVDYDVLPFVNAHSCSSWHQFSRLAAVVAILFATVKGGTVAWCSVAHTVRGPCSKETWAHFV